MLDRHVLGLHEPSALATAREGVSLTEWDGGANVAEEAGAIENLAQPVRAGLALVALAPRAYDRTMQIYQQVSKITYGQGYLIDIIFSFPPNTLVKRSYIHGFSDNSLAFDERNSGSVSANQLIFNSAVKHLLSQEGLSRLRRSGDLRKKILGFTSSDNPVSAVCARLANALLDDLPPNFPFPQVRKSSECEIGFFWLNGEDRVEAFLQPEDERLVWIAKFDGSFVRGGDEQWSETLPTGLIGMLARLYK